MRANETASDILLKATQVDGVYSADPKLDKNAKKLDHLTYHDLVSKNLRIMDTSAVSLCRDNQMPILVFNLNKPGNILKAVMGEKVGTFVDSGGDSADV